jgi:hypothetical protein
MDRLKGRCNDKAKGVRLNSIPIGVIPVMVLLAGRSPVGTSTIFLAGLLVVLGLMLLASLMAAGHRPR